MTITSNTFGSIPLAVIQGLKKAIEAAQQGQADAGRSAAGRRWSVIVTELEKVDAVVRRYNVQGLDAPPQVPDHPSPPAARKLQDRSRRIATAESNRAAEAVIARLEGAS